jgi:hypothetical protein
MKPRHLFTAVAAATISACGSSVERQPAQDTADIPGQARDHGSSATTPIVGAALPESCDLIPPAEIERIAGPLQGAPTREGHGCWYNVVMDTLSAEWRELRDRAQRARAGGMDERAIELYHPTRAGLYVEATVDVAGERSDSAPPGWDETRLSRTGAVFHGRAGHVRVFLRLQKLSIPGDTVMAIASRVRDRIPDGPIAHPAADRSGRQPPSRDPCSLLTRDEAEPVLGKLVAEPLRSHEGTPLADPSGKSCAYLTAGHRALVLTPTWEYGRVDVNAVRMVGGLVRQVADLPGIEGDTLEGPWDEAIVDMEGQLLLRKGADALAIGYRASSTDASGAIGLAKRALERLAASPQPE